MANEFYDPLVQTAGAIAEKYEISVADVLALLLHADRDEALVRKVLAEGNHSEEARAARHAGRQFDLVAYVRPFLQSALDERKPG